MITKLLIMIMFPLISFTMTHRKARCISLIAGASAAAMAYSVVDSQSFLPLLIPTNPEKSKVMDILLSGQIGLVSYLGALRVCRRYTAPGLLKRAIKLHKKYIYWYKDSSVCIATPQLSYCQIADKLQSLYVQQGLTLEDAADKITYLEEKRDALIALLKTAELVSDADHYTIVTSRTLLNDLQNSQEREGIVKALYSIEQHEKVLEEKGLMDYLKDRFGAAPHKGKEPIKKVPPCALALHKERSTVNKSLYRSNSLYQ